MMPMKLMVMVMVVKKSLIHLRLLRRLVLQIHRQDHHQAQVAAAAAAAAAAVPPLKTRKENAAWCTPMNAFSCLLW